jgi:hypothetical protein
MGSKTRAGTILCLNECEGSNNASPSRTTSPQARLPTILRRTNRAFPAAFAASHCFLSICEELSTPERLSRPSPSGKGLRNCCNQGVAVEKLQFLRNSRNLGDRKCLGKPGKSFVGLRRAEFFDQFWETEFFNSHACYRQSTRGAQCRRSVAVRIVGSLVVRVLGRFLRKRGEF